ncbi:MAG: type VI secretion system protein TssA [Caulobacteraceae bacterium]|nr:type VI secretion system protein TssA [Caulobacteraceae bacterium]
MALAEDLLAPVSEDSPAGDDLAYDAQRQELEQAFEASFSIAMTGDGGGGDDTAGPDWRKVIRNIEKQFARTKDIWLAVYLCRAGARSGQIDVVETGAQVLAGLFERYWDEVHPRLDELGVPGRATPVASLARPAEFLRPLNRAPLIVHPRLGAFSGEDLERFRQEGDAADGYGLFQAALSEIDPAEVHATAARLKTIETALREADAIFTAKAAPEQTPNLAPAFEALDKLQRGIAYFVGETAAPAEEAPAAEEASEATEAPLTRAARGGAPSRPESREDVVKAIDLICDYYRRCEPSSPVPLLLMRARNWVTLDFLGVLNEIAPGSLGEARQLLVSRDAT